jgi:hypothetical protein
MTRTRIEWAYMRYPLLCSCAQRHMVEPVGPQGDGEHHEIDRVPPVESECGEQLSKRFKDPDHRGWIADARGGR